MAKFNIFDGIQQAIKNDDSEAFINGWQKYMQSEYVGEIESEKIIISILIDGSIECFKKLVESNYSFAPENANSYVQSLCLYYAKHAFEEDKNRYLNFIAYTAQHFKIDLNTSSYSSEWHTVTPRMLHYALSPELFSLFLKLGANTNLKFDLLINRKTVHVDLLDGLEILATHNDIPELYESLKILREFKTIMKEKDGLDKSIPVKKTNDSIETIDKSTKDNINKVKI